MKIKKYYLSLNTPEDQEEYRRIVEACLARKYKLVRHLFHSVIREFPDLDSCKFEHDWYEIKHKCPDIKEGYYREVT